MNRTDKILCPSGLAGKIGLTGTPQIALAFQPILAFAALTLLFALGGCVSQQGNGSSADELLPEPGLYFESAEAGVEITRQLLRAKNWKTLARYYDLSGTDYTAEDLEGGHFFVRPDRPAEGHPAVWQYRQPFHPAYEFDSAQETDQEGLWEITVRVEIDQGGGMTQRGFDTFQMTNSEVGWQLLPK